MEPPSSKFAKSAVKLTQYKEEQVILKAREKERWEDKKNVSSSNESFSHSLLNFLRQYKQKAQERLLSNKEQ